MYENKTYEALLASALARVRGDIDKREGSMVMNGVAPSMAELAQLYIAADFVFRATYLATAPREYLILRAADRNMAPYPASAAVYRAEFNIEVPEGTRFSCEDLNFVVTGYPEDHEDAEGVISHLVACETAGTVANNYSGRLVPMEHVSGLTSAQLVELITPGDDEEDTEEFRQRVLDSYQSQAFGGNRADYMEKLRTNYGVEVKLHTAWNGDISPASLVPSEKVVSLFEEYKGAIKYLDQEVQDWALTVYHAAKDKKLTVGGAVRLVIMDTDHTVPDSSLIKSIQEAVDPSGSAGEGKGFAPIGHVVSVVGVTAEPLDISFRLVYADGWDWEKAESYVRKVVETYFAELAQGWAKSDHLTVRLPIIASRILLDRDCTGVIESVLETRVNGQITDLALDADSIPTLNSISEITDDEGAYVNG